MPMTVVRAGDTSSSIRDRLGLPPATILVDAAVVDAFRSAGVPEDALRDAILAHGAGRTGRRSRVDVPGGDAVELHGRLEGDRFSLDRMICGDVTYYATRDGETAHVADYSWMRSYRPHDPAGSAGLRLRDLVGHHAFRGERSPTVRRSERNDGDALRVTVERTTVEI